MTPADNSTSTTDPKLDEALEETFPASDPPANTVETGIRTGEAAASATPSVIDNPSTQRFEVTVNGYIAFLAYERTAQTMTVIHTEVPEPLRGRRLGEVLVKAAVDGARGEHLRLIVVCPFARAYLNKHPELRTGTRNLEP